MKLRLALEAWQQAHEQGGNPLRFAITTPWIWGRSFLAQHIGDLEPFRTAPAAISPHAYRALLAGALPMDSAEPALASYSGPLLAVTGDEDVLTPEPYAQEFISAAGRGRTAVLRGVGHAGPLERPDVFAPLLRDFIQSAERNAHAG